MPKAAVVVRHDDSESDYSSSDGETEVHVSTVLLTKIQRRDRQCWFSKTPGTFHELKN